jgi:hypothetical protein
MQLAADERRPKSLLRLLKAQVSSSSERTVVERVCGSQSGANAPNRCECAGLKFIAENAGGDQACAFASREAEAIGFAVALGTKLISLRESRA